MVKSGFLYIYLKPTDKFSFYSAGGDQQRTDMHEALSVKCWINHHCATHYNLLDWFPNVFDLWFLIALLATSLQYTQMT